MKSMRPKGKILGLIPARGGSKGVPKKNLRSVGGRSLLERAIQCGLGSKYIDEVVVSTDSAEIATEAKRLGAAAPFLRPDELSNDVAGSVDVALHAVNALTGFDWIVLLQPTSPFRRASDIDHCLELCWSQNAFSAATVSEASTHPYWTFQIGEGQRLDPFFETSIKRRQDLPEAYALNGMVYACSVQELQTKRSFAHKDTVGYLIAEQWRSLDIDTEEDMKLANYLSSEFET